MQLGLITALVWMVITAIADTSSVSTNWSSAAQYGWDWWCLCRFYDSNGRYGAVCDWALLVSLTGTSNTPVSGVHVITQPPLIRPLTANPDSQSTQSAGGTKYQLENSAWLRGVGFRRWAVHFTYHWLKLSISLWLGNEMRSDSHPVMDMI